MFSQVGMESKKALCDYRYFSIVKLLLMQSTKDFATVCLLRDGS